MSARAEDVEQAVAALWEATLGAPAPSRTVPFFEAGGGSLHWLRLHSAIERRFGPIPIGRLFAHPTIAAQAALLTQREGAHPPRSAKETNDAVAIVGRALRSPGARDVEGFWRLVRAGEVSISRFEPGEIEDAFTAAERASPDYVPARGVLDDVECFDARYFGMSPREAALTDPQHRVFLEIALHALEDAAIDPQRFAGRIGVFAGASMNTYLLRHVLADRAAVEAFATAYQVGMYTELVGALADTLAARVAYKLDLTGPALTVQSACSTSLAAVAQAMQSLRAGACDAAIAGGVSITFPQKRGYLALEGGLASRDGACRPFDAAASGTVFSSGAGAVVLRRLDDALADGDPIVAILRGAGMTNDGAAKPGFTAPSPQGQAGAIRAALADADCAPETIGHIECHGTATPLGDPIEIEGLIEAYGATGAACALGSAKANIGHCDAAAGVVGLIRAVESVRRGELPPLAGFVGLNPHISLDRTRFYIPRAATTWMSDGPRRAGVSAFGVGGTNAHVIVEQAPEAPILSATNARAQLLVMSATDEAGLDRLRADIAEGLDGSLADLAATLALGRRALSRRAFVVGRDHAEVASALRGAIESEQADRPPRIVFAFPGQGAQTPGMARALYDRSPTFAAEIDRLVGLYASVDAAKDLSPALFGDVALADTAIVQPALFVVSRALAALWSAMGLRPDVVLGHSVGEFAAAAVAGVMSDEDALRFLADRAVAMTLAPPGAMLAARLTAEAAARFAVDGVDVAAVNAPGACVLAGPIEAIERTQRVLDGQGVASRRLGAERAFHSASMDEVAEALRAPARGMNLHAPTIAFASSATGGREVAALAEPDYWARHCRAPVRFADALRAAVKAPSFVVEVGPGRTLSAFAAQTLPPEILRGALASSAGDADEDESAFLLAAGRLWRAGADIDLAPILVPGSRRRAGRTRYPFARDRFFVDLPAAAPLQRTPIAAAHPAEAPLMPPVVDSPELLPELLPELASMLSALVGGALPEGAHEATFLELGCDSLMLGQFAAKIDQRFKVRVPFRRLLRDLPTLRALADHVTAEGGAALRAEPTPQRPPAAPIVAPSLAPDASALSSVFKAQLDAMSALIAQQNALLAGGAERATLAPAQTPAAAAPMSTPTPIVASASRFRAYDPKAARRDGLSAEHTAIIAELTQRWNAKTPASKAYAERHRATLADPRSVSGFRPEWKELVYPIVAARAHGSKIVDLDGNTYVDLVNGYGQTAFGHAPDFVREALSAQADAGFAIGPQSPLAGEVAEEIAAMIGMERVTFCNTGSEAVMAAMRVARCVTGRDKIVVFANDYHGQFDEVLVRARAGSPGAAPLAPGIPQRAVDDMIVLAYGEATSLDWIAANAHDLAAVVVEPVQSRHPELRPFDFLRALREATSRSDVALVFDEVVTGFRTHQGGMQAVLGIRADMATYGKVLGGGMPIGVLAGSARYMDALDGGAWRFGDDSAPETSPTFFAGTFVRHPLVLAACKATLHHMRENGPGLQERLAQTTAGLVARLRHVAKTHNAPITVESFSSWFMIEPARDEPLAPLLFAALRLNGVHAQDGFPCFLTTTHDATDLQAIEHAFAASLVDCGFARATRATSPRKAAPLTEPQKEILFASSLGAAAGAAFIESVRIDLQGPLDAERMTRAFDALIARHDALRVRINREALLMEECEASLPLKLVDLRHAPDPDESIAAALDADARTPFELDRGPLVRGALFLRSNDTSVLAFSAHHIICDGWSMGAIVSDLAALYAAQTPAAARSFLDYAAQAKPSGEATRAYWRERFRSEPERMTLPADRPSAPRAFNGATVTDRLDASLVAAFKQACARRGATLFSGLFAALSVVLARLSGVNDVVIGAPVARQSADEALQIVGHMVDFLPLRVLVDPERPFACVLESAAAETGCALDHADITYGEICRMLGLVRDSHRPPLTSVQFNLERFPEQLMADGVSLRLAPNPKSAIVFDAFFNMIESVDGLRVDVDYDRDLFEPATIRRWIENLRVLLRGAATDMDAATVAALPLLGDDERKLLLARARSTQGHPFERTIPEAFGDVVTAAPAGIALECGAVTMSYRDLDRASDAVAKCLVCEGIGAGDVVALFAERGVDAIIAMLGVLKTGAAFAPFEPKTPTARLHAMLADSGARLALTTGAELPAVQSLQIAQAIKRGDAASGVTLCGPAHPGVAAAIMYTSGSTGRPKGVIVPHRAISGLVADQTFARFAADETWLQAAPLAFDASTLEIWGALLQGGRLVIDAADPMTLDGLERTIRDKNITSLWLTAALFHVVIDERIEAFAPLRQALAGGDVLSPAHVRRLMTRYPQLRIINGYGPTECTTFTACCDVRACDWTNDSVPIGAPIRGRRCYVLDAHDALAPIGAIGELVVAGEGLANGYLGDEARTRERFVTIGGDVCERVYRTGDLVRWRADRQLAFVGRKDQQLKVNGLRVELGEIETILRSQEGVADAAVIAHKDGLGGARLEAIVSIGRGVDETEQALLARLARALSERLPASATPRLALRREALPQTRHGKIDRAALAASPSAPASPENRALSPTEERIAAVWRDVLGTTAIGAHDSLFELGADSLKIFRIAARFAQQGLPIEARDMMANPSLAALGQLVDETQSTAATLEKPAISLADFKRGKRPS